MNRMVKSVILILMCLSTSYLSAQVKPVDIVTWDQVIEETELHPDKIYIINFWATWCRPCIQELPDFEEVNQEFKDKGVEVLLMSMDEKAYIHTSLEPFVKERGLKSKVYLLEVEDYNEWIPSISSKWGGEIPATLIIYIDKDKRIFKAGKYTKEELVEIINQLKS